MSDRITVIYHAPCRDGALAAWCASLHFGRDNNNVGFHPAKHGTEPPWSSIENSGKVFILDFSYSREDMQKMATMTELLVLDHHASAQARCHGLDFCQFDMNRSGSGMAWDHFFPKQDRPWFVDYVEDGDLWAWKLENSREALAYIDTMPRSFATWDCLYQLGTTQATCISRGFAIRAYVKQYIDETITAGLRHVTFADPDGNIYYDIPIINASFIGISELVAEAAAGYDFALGWFRQEEGTYKFSVRVPKNSDFDASKFASRFGGGGHVKAAGFVLDAELEELETTD